MHRQQLLQQWLHLVVLTGESELSLQANLYPVSWAYQRHRQCNICHTALQKNVNLRPRAIYCSRGWYIARVQNIDQILSNLVKFAYSTVWRAVCVKSYVSINLLNFGPAPSAGPVGTMWCLWVWSIRSSQRRSQDMQERLCGADCCHRRLYEQAYLP